MFYSDDPVRDFERHDREQQKRLEQLPECDKCGDPIQDDHFYEIEGKTICPHCLETYYKRANDM